MKSIKTMSSFILLTLYLVISFLIVVHATENIENLSKEIQKVPVSAKVLILQYLANDLSPSIIQHFFPALHEEIKYINIRPKFASGYPSKFYHYYWTLPFLSLPSSPLKELSSTLYPPLLLFSSPNFEFKSPAASSELSVSEPKWKVTVDLVAQGLNLTCPTFPTQTIQLHYLPLYTEFIYSDGRVEVIPMVKYILHCVNLVDLRQIRKTLSVVRIEYSVTTQNGTQFHFSIFISIGNNIHVYRIINQNGDKADTCTYPKIDITTFYGNDKSSALREYSHTFHYFPGTFKINFGFWVRIDPNTLRVKD